jgi:hypothetical protein
MWNGFEDVDARNKCGHDESEIVAVGIRGHKSWCSRKVASDTLSVRVVLRRPAETRCDVHGQHAEQLPKTS